MYHYIIAIISNLWWKYYEKKENEDPLASNEYCHHVGYGYQLLSEEEDVEEPIYSHHHNQRCESLDPVPRQVTFLH